MFDVIDSLYWSVSSQRVAHLSRFLRQHGAVSLMHFLGALCSERTSWSELVMPLKRSSRECFWSLSVVVLFRSTRAHGTVSLCCTHSCLFQRCSDSLLAHIMPAVVLRTMEQGRRLWGHEEYVASHHQAHVVPLVPAHQAKHVTTTRTGRLETVPGFSGIMERLREGILR